MGVSPSGFTLHRRVFSRHELLVVSYFIPLTNDKCVLVKLFMKHTTRKGKRLRGRSFSFFMGMGGWGTRQKMAFEGAKNKI